MVQQTEKLKRAEEVVEELERHVLNCGPCRGDRMVGSPTVHLRWLGQFILKQAAAVRRYEERKE